MVLCLGTNMNADGLQMKGGRTGGVYIPPFKLAQLKKNQEHADDPASADNQKLSWEALRKSINGLINKVNVSNIKNIIPELFQENLIRGRGLFARAIMKAQLASPGFTHIYSALIAVINTKLPENGELILKRVIYGFKRAIKRRDKNAAIGLSKFIAHLVNHQVAHELLALQLLTVLLEEPTDDSVEIAVNFVKEVGQILEELSPQGLHAIFERFRGILHEGDIDKRVQYTVEGLFAIWKSGFKDYPAIPPELDLVEREDQITFEVGLDDNIDKEDMLDIFRFDINFAENEKLWDQIKKEILGDDDENDDEGDSGAVGDDESIEGQVVPVAEPRAAGIIDLTEQDLVNLRRSIYLTIMSSISFEECCHKLVKLNIPDGYEAELCNMLIECCANERSYQRYYGLMGQRFCMMHRKYQDAFDDSFLQQYSTIHRLETNKLRNVAKFFSHLLSTDALPWTCFEYIKLNENDTTSSSRIFIKILVQELAESLGLSKLRDRFMDEYMQEVFSGMFPKDNARNTRFAINYFTSIGLGGLTDELREHLKNLPKLMAQQLQEQQKMLQAQARSRRRAASSSSDSSSESSSSSSGSGSSYSDSSSQSGSDSDGYSSSSSTTSNSSSSSSCSSTSSRSTQMPKRQNTITNMESMKNFPAAMKEISKDASKASERSNIKSASSVSRSSSASNYDGKKKPPRRSISSSTDESRQRRRRFSSRERRPTLMEDTTSRRQRLHVNHMESRVRDSNQRRTRSRSRSHNRQDKSRKRSRSLSSRKSGESRDRHVFSRKE